MKKTLYSMMLDEDVVREIDLLAHRYGTTRSGMVNQILAERVNMVTPESRVNDVFNLIADLMDTASGLIPVVLPNTRTMSLKSSLEYRYRPTVKYDVEIYRDKRALGKLSAKFRTQSQSLADELTRFFALWNTVEVEILPSAPGWSVVDNKFSRLLLPPNRDVSADTLANRISDYVKLLDAALKQYLAGGLDIYELRRAYAAYLTGSELII